jgi:predicted nucleotidyltransferase
MDLELPNDFREFLQLLNTNEVRYLLIGGFAVGLYGYPRTTNEIDIFVASDEENARRLVKALKELAFPAESLSIELFTDPNSVVAMGVAPVKVELLNFASGLEFEKAYENRATGNLGGIEISLISLEDLKINKKASGRHKDLDDLEHLDDTLIMDNPGY